MSPPILVACYSLGGHTRTLASEIAAALGADLVDIREPHPRRGLGGVLRALYDGVRRRLPPVLAPDRLPSQYHVLVLGGPVWAGRLAAPVRRFARDYGAQAPVLAGFCTLGGRGAEEAFIDLAGLAGRAPVATLAVDQAHRTPDQHRCALQSFLGVIRSHAT